MNLFVTLYLWLSTMLGVPTPTGEDAPVDVGDKQAMTQDAKGKSSKNRGLTRKGFIYNGF